MAQNYSPFFVNPSTRLPRQVSLPSFDSWCPKGLEAHAPKLPEDSGLRGMPEEGLLGGGNSNIFYFRPKVGEDFQFDEYFSNGLKPPTSLCSGSYSVP